jgi:hypothetical protein
VKPADLEQDVDRPDAGGGEEQQGEADAEPEHLLLLCG